MTARFDTDLPAARLSRRTLLKSAGALTGLVLCLRASGALAAAETKVEKYGVDASTGGAVDNPLVFVSIDPDSTVHVTVHRSEMGQGIRTSLAMVIADELDAEWLRVRVHQAPGDEARYGDQFTDGSRSMLWFFEPMRRVGAAARMMLEAAAAARWGVETKLVAARNHEIVNLSSGERLSYGEVAADAAKLKVPERKALRLKKPADFRYIGKEAVPLVDGPDIVSGRAQYGVDVQHEGLVFAVIARPPVFGGKLKSFDATRSLKIPGVIKVVEIAGHPTPAEYHPLGGVAVIATNTWAAMQGREALAVQWEEGPNASYSSTSYKATLEQSVRAPGKAMRNEGDVDKALTSAARLLDAEYYVPHLSHAPMEPPTATAKVTGSKCEVWAPVQVPQGARELVAKRLGLKLDDVTVNVTLLGGAFGRKAQHDFVVEAALLSKALEGRPVKVIWTREDDIRHDFYHAVSLQRLEAGLDDRGRVVAWRHRSASPPVTATFEVNGDTQGPIEMGLGAVNVPFRVPNFRVEAVRASAHTRIGFFRSVNNIQHAFAVQSFVSELAAAANRDPKDFLLDLLGPPRLIDPRTIGDNFNYGESPVEHPIDIGRYREVIEVVAREAGWGRALPKGHGLGIAAINQSMSYLAMVVHVFVSDKGELRIPRIDLAYDCGQAINPERVRALCEGGCIMGVGLALDGEISFTQGRVDQSNFHDYPIPRMPEAPRDIRFHLIQRGYDVPMGGAGEPGNTLIAPALCNAIFAATGRRIRRLPIRAQLAGIAGT